MANTSALSYLSLWILHLPVNTLHNFFVFNMLSILNIKKLIVWKKYIWKSNENKPSSIKLKFLKFLYLINNKLTVKFTSGVRTLLFSLNGGKYASVSGVKLYSRGWGDPSICLRYHSSFIAWTSGSEIKTIWIYK